MKMRRMRQTDLPTILKIENANFPYPWTHEEFLNTLKLQDVSCFVVEIDSKVVAYIVYEEIASAECFHILNLAVSPDWQKQGIGRFILKKLMSKPSWLSISLLVSDRNLNCHLFLKKMKFEAFSVAKDYFGDDHDAYEFMYLRPMDDKKNFNDEACTEI